MSIVKPTPGEVAVYGHRTLTHEDLLDRELARRDAAKRLRHRPSIIEPIGQRTILGLQWHDHVPVLVSHMDHPEDRTKAIRTIAVMRRLPGRDPEFAVVEQAPVPWATLS